VKLRDWTAAAVFLLSPGLPIPAAHAETACESEDVLKYLPPGPRGCQTQRIQATGALTFGVVQSPGRIARKAWQRQVVFFFGERYQDWEKAACKKELCVRATFAGSRRCTYSAFPCASDTDPAALAALSTRQIAPREVRNSQPMTAPMIEERQPARGEARRSQPSHEPRIEEPRNTRKEARDREPLTKAEIKELQELLREAGYCVWADGIPGDQTGRALSRWQRKRRLPDNGRLDRASLEILRHAYAARDGTGSP
jgi:hypothetical protein